MLLRHLLNLLKVKMSGAKAVIIVVAVEQRKAREKMKKFSEWLKQHAESHGIYDAKQKADCFKAETGFDAPWPVHTVRETTQAILNRGLGGHIKGCDEDTCCWGYQMAAGVARKFAGFTSDKMGRGFLFWDCVEALEKKGL